MFALTSAAALSALPSAAAFLAAVAGAPAAARADSDRAAVARAAPRLPAFCSGLSVGWVSAMLPEETA